MSKPQSLREQIRQVLPTKCYKRDIGEQCEDCDKQVDAILQSVKDSLPEKKAINENFKWTGNQERKIGFNEAVTKMEKEMV